MWETRKFVQTAFLPLLQLSLGLFLIIKTTPLWAVIHCTLAYLIDCCHFPLTDYKQLRKFKGRVFKKVISHATTTGRDVCKVEKHKGKKRSTNIPGESETGERVCTVKYLGEGFQLQRIGEDKMQVVKLKNPKDWCTYYITDKMWKIMKYIENVGEKTVFVKNHKQIWEEVVTGDIMEFEEVVDSVVLDNREVVRLDQDYFLPVNLLLAEDKLRATLNFVGIFLQTQKHVHWIISAALSFTAAVMGFSTTLRLSIVGPVGKILCRGVQLVCDMLPYGVRRFVYAWGSWVEGFKPSNDIEAKIIKGDVEVLVGGGAKFQSPSHDLQPISSADSSVDEMCCDGGPILIRHNPNCDSNCESKHDKIDIEWMFEGSKCSLKAGVVAPNRQNSLQEIISCGGEDGKKKKVMFFKFDDTHSVQVRIESTQNTLMADSIHTASVDIDCSAEEAKKLFKFAACMAGLKSGSLKSYDSKSGNVYVRRFIDSTNAYVRSGYPPLYKLQLRDVVVR